MLKRVYLCCVIFICFTLFLLFKADNVYAVCDSTWRQFTGTCDPPCAGSNVYKAVVTYKDPTLSQADCKQVEYFTTSACDVKTVLDKDEGCTTTDGCQFTGNSICADATTTTSTNSSCLGSTSVNSDRTKNTCQIVDCGSKCSGAPGYTCNTVYAKQSESVGTPATNKCTITDSTKSYYCHALAPTTAPTTAPAPTSAPAGSCTFTDPSTINHKVANSNDCVGISGSGTCPCSNTASFNYTDDNTTCNIYPGGVQTGAESYSFDSINCIAPTPAPTPNCDSELSCGDCTGAAANTCSTNNGTQSCQYTTHSSGVDCTTVSTSRSCTVNNCSYGFKCEWGSCVDVGPWIQTTGGDVHSQVGINTPGGP